MEVADDQEPSRVVAQREKEYLPDTQEVADFVQYMTREPPFRAIGQVIHAGADVDMGLHAMCEIYGKAWPESFGASIDQRVRYLFSQSDLDPGVLRRVVPAMENRNLLAHGTWLNLHAKGDGFVTRVKETPDLRGKLIDDETLEEWRRELQDIADYFTSRYLTTRGL